MRRAGTRAGGADLRSQVREEIGQLVQGVEDQVEQVVDAVKPHLRGWLHLVAAPLALLCGMILIATAPTQRGRVAALVYTVTAGLLFTTSAVYHRGTWSPRLGALLRRMDHANIFLIIAGSYTPFALLLPSDQARQLLTIVWSGAILGVLFRVLWIGAPRWLYVPVYMALGWVAVLYLGPLVERGGWTIIGFLVAGGVFYTLGALVYGFKRPDPSPRWFGFHEVFHALTILAFVSHFVGAALALHAPAAA